MNISTATKVAIITGSSRGIGAAIAKRLDADGVAVIINYVGQADAANIVVQKIEAKLGHAVAIQADVSAPAQVAAIFDQAIAHYEGVDILVNNAGIMQPGLISLADMDQR